MNIEPTTLSWVGAWGQICSIVLGIVFWSLGMLNGFLVAFVGYFIVTHIGIIGIARTESGFDGAIMLPFIVPGFVPLYYFATQ